VTYGTPIWIWSVAVDDALYVRGYNGQQRPDHVEVGINSDILPLLEQAVPAKDRYLSQ
jgi:hypothetical protein